MLPTPSPTVTPVPTFPPSPLPTLTPSFAPTQLPTLHPEIFVSTYGPLLLSESDNKNGGGGGARVVTVWLSNAPTADVYVVAKSLNGQVSLNGTRKDAVALDTGFGMVGPFTAENWETPQSFSVAALDDDLAEWSEADFTYTTQNPSLAPTAVPTAVPTAATARRRRRRLLEVTATTDEYDEWYLDAGYQSALAAWSAAQHDGHGGDDDVDVYGVSRKDTRYSGLRPEGGSVRCLVSSDDVSGLKLSYDAATTTASTSTATTNSVGNTSLSIGVTEGLEGWDEEGVNGGLAYSVTLRSKPRGVVLVAIASVFEAHRWLVANSTTAATFTPSELVFTTLNWLVPQSVTITVSNDDIARRDSSFLMELTHDVTSGADPSYALAATTQPVLELTVTEDDTAGLFFSTTKLFMGCDFDGNVLFGDFYTLALTSQPTHGVKVTLTAWESGSTGLTAPLTHVGTQDFVFGPGNWNTEEMVVVNATSYDLKKRSDEIFHKVVSLDYMYGYDANSPASGTFAADSVGVTNNGWGPSMPVSVTVSRDSTPPPKLTTTYFRSVGGGAELLFDRFTNYAGLSGKFDCSKLLTGPAIDGIGAGGFCNWQSSTLLAITLSADATVLPGEFFYIRNRMLQSSAPNTTLYVVNATGRLLAPPTAVAPAVILTAPSVIGACDVLTVDARLTTGSGGRNLFVVWNVTFPNGLRENTSVFNLTSAVELATLTNALFVKVPKGDLPIADMVFTMQASNWLGNSDGAVVEVKKVDADPPLVQVQGYGTSTTAFASDELKLTASATLPACGGSGKLQFQWREPSGLLTASELASISTMQPRTIRIPAGLLKAGLAYAFEATVFLGSAQSVNGTATLLVNAKASPLFASIGGGSKTLQYRGNAIALDGSGSYDPDNTANNDHLNFSWTCYDKYTGESCQNATGANVGGLVLVQPFAVTTVSAFTLTAGDFVLRLWVKSLSDGRNATASVEVTLAATQVPIVSIAPLTVVKVNPNPGTYVSLQGTIAGDETAYGVVTYEWTKTEGDDAVFEDSGYSSVFAVSATRLLTVLELGALTQGSTYSFRLTATASGEDDRSTESVAGFAEVSVLINSPPSSGLFSVSPGSGVALQTEFSLVCSSWVDDVDDLPLKYGFRAAPGVDVASAATTQTSEQVLVALGTTPSYTTLLPEGDLVSGNVSLVAYITDRYSGKTRTTTMVEVQSLADSFAASLGGRRRLADSDAFADFMLNLTSTLMDDAAAVGSSEDMYKNANQLVSVANSPSGSAGMSTDKQVEFVGGLVTSMINAAETMERSEENTELMFGSMGSVANGQPERMNDAAQAKMLSGSLALLSTAALPGSRMAISEASSTSACTALSTLMSSDQLFGAGNSNSSNNSAALSAGLNNLASGKLVGRFAGMGATETSCSGVLLSAQKLSSEDTDGMPIVAGNSSFTMPADFSLMANLSAGDTIETSAQVLDSNPHRGSSSAAINTDLTSLSMMVTRAERTDGGTDPLPVHNLSSPISIRIPVKSLGASSSSPSNADDGSGGEEKLANMTLNVTCPATVVGEKRVRAVHSCPGGAFINYTCDATDLEYVIRLTCSSGAAHQCVFWDTTLLGWSSEGCQQVGVIATGEDSGFVICNCTHLTDFASQLDETLELASNVVTSVASLSISDLLKNILVLIVLIVVWGIMLVACVYSRYLDGVARKKVVPFGHLEDSDDEGDDGSDKKDDEDESAVEAVVRFFAKGDGTDYGQMPDTLTPAALTRRMSKRLLKWHVYKDQSDEVIERNRPRLWAANTKLAPLSNDNIEKKQLSPWGVRSTKVVPYTIQETNVVPYQSGLMPAVPVDVTADGQLVTVASTSSTGPRPSMLTVTTLKTILEKEKSKSSMRGKLLLDWWEFMKTQHKVLSIVYNKDTIFTRPERIMTIGIFFLFTMAVNSFLFIFQGNANSGGGDAEIFLNNLTYVVLVSVCQTPLMFLIILLFKRTASTRPTLEDRWVGAVRSEIPKKVRKSVESREAVLRAERAVRKAKESIVQDRRMLRIDLEERLQRAIAAGHSALTDDETAEVVLLAEQCETEATVDLAAAKAQLEEAAEVMLQIRAARQAWVDQRLLDLLGDPAFLKPTGWDRVEIWVLYLLPKCGTELSFMMVKWRAKRTADLDLAKMFLSREELAIVKAEKEQMAKFGDSWRGWFKQWMYRKYLNPLRDIENLLAEDFFLPGRLVYAVHAFVIVLALFCSYYTFLFSVMLNRCAKCGPADSLDDDDAQNCSSCPDSMRDNNDAKRDLAVDWLITLLYTLLFNIFIMEPVKVGTQAAIYPLFVNSWLAIKWDKYLLAADRARELEEDVSDDEDENLFSAIDLNESEQKESIKEKEGWEEQESETKEYESSVERRRSDSEMIGNLQKAWSSKLFPSITERTLAETETALPQSPTMTNVEMLKPTPITILPLKDAETEVGSPGNAFESDSNAKSTTDEAQMAPRRKHRHSKKTRKHKDKRSPSHRNKVKDPPWECACGVKTFESGRLDHLGECKLFKRSWNSALAVLTRSHYKQFNAQQLESLADSEALGGDVGGGTVRKSPLTIERRLAALERAIEFHHDKELASADQAAPASAAASISEVKTTEEGLASMTNASLDHAATVRWWTRGMLLASFVECGGDWRKAAAKLCGSGSKRNASDNKATAEMYRTEMAFVAKHVGLEALLEKHNQKELERL